MSITVVSAPSTPTPPTAAGSDVSAAGQGQDFANLLLGQLTTAHPLAAGQTDLPITDAAPADAALAVTTPTDAAALLAALGLTTTPSDAKPSAAAPADQAPADDAAPGDTAPLDAAASMLAALGLATAPAIAPAPNSIKPDQPAGEPLTAVSGNTGQSPKVPVETLTLNAAAAQNAAAPADDQAAKFAATLATAEETVGIKNDSTAAMPDNLSSVTSNVASTPVHPTVHRDSSLTVSTPVRDQNWAADLGQKVVWLANADKQSAQLTLNPPEMGPIEISLDVDKGTASVSFTSANAEVRDALETALPKLREMFASAGIELGQTNVGAESFSQQQAKSSEQNQSSSRGRGMGDNAILAAETSGTLQTGVLATRQGNGMVDLFA